MIDTGPRLTISLWRTSCYRLKWKVFEELAGEVIPDTDHHMMLMNYFQNIKVGNLL